MAKSIELNSLVRKVLWVFLNVKKNKKVTVKELSGLLDYPTSSIRGELSRMYNFSSLRYLLEKSGDAKTGFKYRLKAGRDMNLDEIHDFCIRNFDDSKWTDKIEEKEEELVNA